MPNYHRARIPGGTYFFTVNLQDRSHTLLVDHIDVLRSAFRATRLSLPFEIVAAAVLPDHLHCIWSLPSTAADNVMRWRLIKTLFVKALPVTEHRSASRARRKERGIWQRRYWEHLISDERDLRAHIDYVHLNPVKHRLVSSATDWRWSSIHRYIRAGILPKNWMESA